MTYRGKVQGGVVVLEQAASLPEGTEVTVEPVPERTAAPAGSLSDSLMELAGRAKGLPPDAAKNHDHYLYGLPKK